MREHAILSLTFLLGRYLLDLAGIRLKLVLDWMFLSDPGDLRDRLLETLYYGHAFPPGLDLMTGLLMKLGESRMFANTHALFQIFGLVLVNAFFYLCRVMGLSFAAAFSLAALFSFFPQSIYFEHLYLYEAPVAALLCLAGALFFRAVQKQSFWVWSGCFLACAMIGWIRSTFHLLWFGAVLVLAVWFAGAGGRWRVVAAATGPFVLLIAVYLKNLLVFGVFGALTWGSAIFTTTTIRKLAPEIREAWVKQGKLSPFAAISIYSGPRAYLPHFATSENQKWPPMLNVLEKQSIGTPNYYHWFFLEINRRRREDALVYVKERPLEYAATVAENAVRFFSAGTGWHPRGNEPESPHYRHRQVLGGYEAVYNRIVHSLPWAPIGFYAFLPAACVWALVRLRALHRQRGAEGRARAALLSFCLLQLGFVTASSVMFTSGESPRYRFQVEAFILLLGALSVADLWRRLRRRVTGASGQGPSP